MKQEKLLVIDFGSSKTAALFFNDKNTPPQEILFGSHDLVLGAKFNYERAAFYFAKILEQLAAGQKLKNCKIIISLPAKAFVFKNEELALKKIKKEIIKNNKRNQQFYIAEPLVSEENSQRGLLPLLEKKELTPFFKAAAGLKTLVPEFCYGFFLFNSAARAKNYYLINLGGKTTEILFFSENALDKIKVLDIGGEHFINDISSVLGLSGAEARKKFFSFNGLFDSFIKKTSGDILTGIIDARAKELFNLLKTELVLPAEEIYITGGLANLPRLPDFLSQYLGCRTINLNEIDRSHNIITQQVYLLSKKASA